MNIVLTYCPPAISFSLQRKKGVCHGRWAIRPNVPCLAFLMTWNVTTRLYAQRSLKKNYTKFTPSTRSASQWALCWRWLMAATVCSAKEPQKFSLKSKIQFQLCGLYLQIFFFFWNFILTRCVHNVFYSKVIRFCLCSGWTYFVVNDMWWLKQLRSSSASHPSPLLCDLKTSTEKMSW